MEVLQETRNYQNLIFGSNKTKKKKRRIIAIYHVELVKIKDQMLALVVLKTLKIIES